LIFDKVALGYTNGRFTYSSRDLQANATVAATTPPPTPPPGGDDGDGGNVPPPRGRGDRPFCVWYDTMILLQFPNSRRWVAAKDVEIGHYVVNIKGDASKVIGVIRGTSDKLHILTTSKGKQIECSPSHRIITTWDEGDPGTPAHLLKTGDRVAIWNEDRIEIDEIASIEILDTPEGSDVITFTLEGDHTYIAGGVFSHNLKLLTE
jgi:Intein/homing endonuclease